VPLVLVLVVVLLLLVVVVVVVLLLLQRLCNCCARWAGSKGASSRVAMPITLNKVIVVRMLSVVAHSVWALCGRRLQFTSWCSLL
jgi:hypothetical protein